MFIFSHIHVTPIFLIGHYPSYDIWFFWHFWAGNYIMLAKILLLRKCHYNKSQVLTSLSLNLRSENYRIFLTLLQIQPIFLPLPHISEIMFQQGYQPMGVSIPNETWKQFYFYLTVINIYISAPPPHNFFFNCWFIVDSTHTSDLKVDIFEKSLHF